MLLAMDVDYREDGSAAAAGLLFETWTAERGARLVTRRIGAVAPYRPGHFFERELPCLLALLDELAAPPDTIVVDGYVWLGPERRPGLGAHLHAALRAGIPVIGVAKTRFAGTPADAELRRGASQRPLYVTAAGLDGETAKARIAAMHGRHRVPTLLAAVDRACRDLV